MRRQYPNLLLDRGRHSRAGFGKRGECIEDGLQKSLILGVLWGAVGWVMLSSNGG